MLVCAPPPFLPQFRSDFSQLVSEFVEDMDRWKRYHRIQMIQSSRNNAQYQTNMKEQQRQLRISQNRASDAVAACERVEVCLYCRRALVLIPVD